MKNLLFLAVFATVFSLFANETKKVSLAELSAVVQKAIKTQAGADKLGDIEREDDDGDITYTVELTKNGQDRTFSVNADGVLVSVEIDLSEVPVAVRKIIETLIGRGKLESVEKDFEDGEVSYDVEMTTTNGADRSFTVMVDGKLERMQIALEETPAVVRKTIEEHTTGAKLGDIYRVFDGGQLSYEANFTRNGRDRDSDVAPNGRLESARVFLSEVPPPAQQTIKEKIGGGKILRIDHIFEEKGVSPYEVEGRVNGKPFNFSVGPKGRFLGMVE